jgi:Tfp pilus assembly protein PilF/ketosteroid isomerase-like protein
MNKKLLYIILSLIFLLSASSIFAETVNTPQRTIADITAGTAEEYYNHGNAYKKQGNLTQAIADYTKAIEIDPKYAAAYSNRGNVYQIQGNFQQAIADYDKAIEINPEIAGFYSNRGNAYQTQSNLHQAIVDYSNAIEKSPNDSTSYYNRGLAYYGIEQYGKSLADYTKAINKNPNKEAYEDFVKYVPVKEASDTENVRNEVVQLFEGKLNLDKKTAMPAPGVAPVTASVATPAAEPAVAPVVTAVAAAASVNPAQVNSKQSKTKSIPEEDVRNLINKWLKSWKSDDMKTYRGCYASNFQSKGMNLNEWVSHKTNVRQKSKKINISIDKLQISVDGNIATAVFTQHYSSAILKYSGKKQLELRKINDEWKIYREIM